MTTAHQQRHTRTPDMPDNTNLPDDNASLIFKGDCKYSPDYQAMGDCLHCGRLKEDHIVQQVDFLDGKSVAGE